MKILLVRLRLIGDVVFTTPAVRALREQFPDAHLTYIVEPAAAPVIAHNPHLNQVIVAPRARGIRQLRADVELGLRLRRERFDLAIDFHGGPRSSLLTFLSGAPRRVGYTIAGRTWMYTDAVDRPRELRRRHSVENQWDLLDPLGAARPDPDRYPTEMTVDSAARTRADERLRSGGVEQGDRLVVMHVSAGNPFRRWPVDHFASVAAALAASDRRVRVIVTSGPSDADAARSVIDAARDRLAGRTNAIVDVGEWPLDELRALLDRTALYIGGDSGPLHIASTSRVPIVALYGPTLPVRSGPWRPAMYAHVAMEVAALDCRPCDQRTCVHGDFRCLTLISPEQVIDAARRLLDMSEGHRTVAI